MFTAPAANTKSPAVLPVSDPQLITAELERVLESPVFRNSKRYSRFLKFIVEQSLLGHADSLKERTLGVEVFDRTPDYDLSADPIVRIGAGEIRKRLAQYYVESGHDNGIRIQLHAGSYVPEFSVPREPNPPALSENPRPVAVSSPVDRSPAHASGLLYRAGIAGIAVVCLAAFLWVYLANRPTPVDRFWGPFLKSANPPLICLGDVSSLFQWTPTQIPGIQSGLNSKDHVALADVEAQNFIAAILSKQSRRVLVANSGSTTFSDLRHQPTVLIGGATNQWSMRSMQSFRFQLVRDLDAGTIAIRDQQDASHLRWVVNFKAPFSTIQKVYAIVARFQDPTTDQPTVIIAGTGANATIAAAEFVTTPASLKEFIDHAPRGWEDRNAEIVLETQMVNGDSGPPHIIATYFW